jgi:hypothetical protein
MLIVEDPTVIVKVLFFTLICDEVYCYIVSHVHLHPYPFSLKVDLKRSNKIQETRK